MSEASGPVESTAADAEAEADEKPERMVFFSDAVAAIALTLLALDLPVPQGKTDQQLWRDLGAHWQTDYFPFLLSFAVIAAFWHAHHELFRPVLRLGPGVVPLNFGFLLMIVALPWVTRVLGEEGDHQVGVVLYAVVLTLIGLVLAGLAVLIRREHLNRPGSDADLVGFTVAMLCLAIVFAGSIPIGFASPEFASWMWLILAVAVRAISRLVRGIRKPSHPET